MAATSLDAAGHALIHFSARLKRNAFALDVAFDTDARVAALLGPSGAGKSTIIDILAGLTRPDEGFLTLGDDVLLDTRAKKFVPAHRRRIAVVFQDALLFPHLTVKQNLAFGRWFAPRDARRIAAAPIVDTLGIGDLMNRWPRTLSGGERQRVGLARALLASPRLLLMDEPLAALDEVRRYEILRLIERLRDAVGIPILYVSHSVEEVGQLADDVIALDRGRVVAQGQPAQAFAAARHLVESRRFGLSSPLSCTIERYDVTRDVTLLAHPAGAITIAGNAGAAGRHVRLQVRATDVSLALSRPEGISIRTVLSGTIETTSEAGPLALVGVRLAGGDLLVASITRISREELGLQKGRTLFCLVKTAALDERQVATT